MNKKQPAIYIITNKKNGTLYTGVTSNLAKRIYEHKNALKGFTAKYGCKILVYYELYEDMEIALNREKQIKNGKRKRKIALIESINPQWLDLFDDIAS